MSKQTDTRPSHRAYQVISIAKDKSKWREIGAGWLHRDMAGMNIKLDSVPVDGEIVVRAINWDAAEDGEATEPADTAEAKRQAEQAFGHAPQETHEA